VKKKTPETVNKWVPAQEMFECWKTELQRIIYKIKTVEHIKNSVFLLYWVLKVYYKKEVIIQLKKTLFA